MTSLTAFLRLHVYQLLFGGFVLLSGLVLFFAIPDSVMTFPLKFVISNISHLPTSSIVKGCTDFLAGVFVVIYLAFGNLSRKQRLISITIFVPINFLMNLIRVFVTIIALDTNYGLYTFLHPALYVVYFIAVMVLLYYLIKFQHIPFFSSITFFFVPIVHISTFEIGFRSTRTNAKRIILAYLITSASGIGINLLFPPPSPPPPCTDLFIETAPLNIDGNAALDAFCAGNGTDGLSWETAHVIQNFTSRRSGTCFNFQNISKYLIIQNCMFRSYYNACKSDTSTSHIGIMLRNCTRVKIVECQFNEFYTGISLFNTSDVVVSNNHILNSTSVNLCGVWFNENYRAFGIECENTYNNTISNNNITSATIGGAWYNYCDNMPGRRLSVILYNTNTTAISSNLLETVAINVGNNNTMVNNTCWSIYLEAGVQNILSNNTGIITLRTGGDNLLINNHASRMVLDRSTNNTLENNSATYFTLGYAWNNTLTNNTANELELDHACNNSLYFNDMPISIYGNSSGNLIDTTNVVGGKPIYYFEDQIGLELSGHISIGQILLLNCNASRIESNTISNNTAGIVLIRCHNNTLVNNSACNNLTKALYLSESSNNSLVNQTVCSNRGYGIQLWNSHNNTLFNCTVSNNTYDGVFLGYSNNTMLSNTTSTNNARDGISLHRSPKSTFINNFIANNAEDGIELYFSQNCDFANNSLTNNKVGIFIDDSTNETLSGNEMWSGGVKLRDSNNLTIDSTNLVNGKPIRYFENQAFGEITGDNPIGQVIILNCQNFLIANINISLVSRGISIDSCQNVSIVNVNASSNGEGIVLSDSNIIVLTNNNVSLNQGDGIAIQSSSDLNISGNTAVDNAGDGINIQGSSNLNVSGNTMVDNAGHGIHLYGLENSNIAGNNFSSNTGSGIEMGGSNHNTFINNSVSDNLHQGLFLTGSIYTNILNNFASHNGESGIELQYSTHNILSGNILTSNYNETLYTANSDFNPVWARTPPLLWYWPPSPENAHYGILLFQSGFNDLSGNIASNNGDGGIKLICSDYNTLSGNTATNNTNEGFHVFHSDYNALVGNVAMYNTNSGIYLDHSSYNNVTGNIVKQNGGACIFQSEHSEGNDIRDNECDEDSMLLVYIIIAIMGVGICVAMIIFRQRHRRHCVAGASLELTNN